MRHQLNFIAFAVSANRIWRRTAFQGATNTLFARNVIAFWPYCKTSSILWVSFCGLFLDVYPSFYVFRACCPNAFCVSHIHHIKSHNNKSISTTGIAVRKSQHQKLRATSSHNCIRWVCILMVRQRLVLQMLKFERFSHWRCVLPVSWHVW